MGNDNNTSNEKLSSKEIVYYYALNNIKFGPYKLHEFPINKIQRDTLIWKTGMRQWSPAHTINEISMRLEQYTPPPIPNTTITPVKTDIQNKCWFCGDAASTLQTFHFEKWDKKVLERRTRTSHAYVKIPVCPHCLEVRKNQAAKKNKVLLMSFVAITGFMLLFCLASDEFYGETTLRRIAYGLTSGIVLGLLLSHFISQNCVKDMPSKHNKRLYEHPDVIKVYKSGYRLYN
jgi:hypothetical protein